MPDINISDGLPVLNLLTVKHDHICRSYFPLSQVHDITLLNVCPIKTFKVFLSSVDLNFTFVDFLVRLSTDIIKIDSLGDRNQDIGYKFCDVH